MKRTALGLVFGALCAASVSAQTDLRDALPPAELPPASFEGTQYVDSRGCVYIRVGRVGIADWVPRVSRAGQHLCGFQPSATARVAPINRVPDGVEVIVPDTAFASAPVEPVAVAPAVIGPAPVAEVTAQLVPQPIPTPVPAPAEEEIAITSLADVCRAVASGRSFRVAATGQVVTCGAVTRGYGASGPARAVTPMAPSAAGLGVGAALAEDTSACAKLPLNFRAGPCLDAARDRSALANLDAPVGVTQAKGLFAQRSAPYSNPIGVTAIPAPPPGYAPVWTDGRINPARGLPKS